jgi:hypothetical protein
VAQWDKFLTDRDKEVLSVWGKKDQDDFGLRPALLLVDVYYGSVGHERKPILESIRDWPMSCGLEGWAAVDRMVEVVAAARTNGVPLIYARGTPSFQAIHPV